MESGTKWLPVELKKATYGHAKEDDTASMYGYIGTA